MKLHNDKELFIQAVDSASRYFKMPQAIIEKDYYVTLVLRELTRRVPELIFKGGTSLSKCYKIINRFSEDIDLTLGGEHITQGQRSRFNHTIIDACDELGFIVLNKTDSRSRRDYNQYRVDYGARFNVAEVVPNLLIESAFMQKSFPINTRQASSMIADYYMAVGNQRVVDMFDLQPFEIRVQSLERTLIDKIFALCDYAHYNQTERQSRHIYDIYRLLTQVHLNDYLKALIQDVREERKGGAKTYSAQDGVDVNKLLRDIVERQVFKSDYLKTTYSLLSVPVSYDEAITGLEMILKSGVFER